MKKKKGNLAELMQYAGKAKLLTYSSWVLSVISAALALVPFVYIFFIIKEVIDCRVGDKIAAGCVYAPAL